MASPRKSPNSPLPPIYGVLGSVLRAVREDAGHTQEQVARAANLTRTSLTNIEKGRQKLLLDTFVDIAKFLGKSANEMLAQVESRISDNNPLSVKIPSDLSQKVHEQIAGMIAGAGGGSSQNAKPSQKINPPKSRSSTK